MYLIKGNLHTDHRGTIRFVNDFTFDGIKRFYTITHPDNNIIRAWQGHKLETKYFYVTKGSFLINWIEIDNWEKPSTDLKINAHTLSQTQSEILIIPPGHVNGFKALEPGSTMMVFSDMLLEDSIKDDFRYPVEYWEIIISR
ncbi:MAG: dTDP-4-dehydrorhamnose 3,5-epimerase family protein [Bacteroidales bacterium]|nr:dTDP-4-dehydrorhamnose 3,5-epimerase family protein [Bacteroidales bacterium]